MCPVTGVSFQLMILQEKGLQAVSPGSQGAEGQAGDTAQVRVLGAPAAQWQLHLSVTPQGARLGWGPVPSAVCSRHQTLCLHPKQSHSRGCCCHPQPQAGWEQQPSRAQGCSLMIPLISSYRHRERQGRGPGVTAFTAWGEIQATCTCSG